MGSCRNVETLSEYSHGYTQGTPNIEKTGRQTNRNYSAKNKDNIFEFVDSQSDQSCKLVCRYT